MRILGAPKVLGVLFLCLLLLGVYATYAIFTKQFADYDEVTLQTSKIGLQLPERADIKVRGVIVGEVLDFQATAEGAELTLGLYPGEREQIPADVTGSIVPKTLFGEKYVSLEIPEGAESGDVAAGRADHRPHGGLHRGREGALRPLPAAAHGAAGRPQHDAQRASPPRSRAGASGWARTSRPLDSYLKRLNPQIPQILDDLRLTAQVSDTYSDVMPQIAEILRNTITTTGTLEDRDAKVRAMFTDVAAFADTSRDFLDTNGDNLIRLGEVSAQQLRLLAKYAPEYPCLLKGIVNAAGPQAEAFRGFTLHIVLETLPNQPRGYNPSDVPRFGDTRGPSCGTSLPTPPYSQANPVRTQPDFDDGIDEPTGKGTSRIAPSYGFAGSADETAHARRPARAGPRRHRRRRARPRRAAGRARWRAAGR